MTDKQTVAPHIHLSFRRVKLRPDDGRSKLHGSTEFQGCDIQFGYASRFVVIFKAGHWYHLRDDSRLRHEPTLAAIEAQWAAELAKGLLGE